MGSMLQVARGAALGGVVAGCLLAAVLVVGLAPGANRFVFVLVATGGLVFWLVPESKSRAAVAGSLLVAAVAAAFGIVTGVGWLEIVLVAGGLSASAWLFASSRPTVSLSPTVAAVVTLVVVLASLLPLVIDGGALGHDESAYALKGRTWLEGTPDSGWTIHRGPALSGYAYLVLAAGGGEAALRLIGPLALVALSLATWWLGSRVADKTVGALAAMVVVAGPAILRRATEHLTDIPAAAGLVVCMALLWNDFEKRDGGPTYRLIWVLPFAWAAFYLRYQSILALGLIGLTMVILWWPRIRERPGPVVATALIGVAGLVPHALQAMSETGSPIGILQFTGGVAGREFLGEGLVEYAMLLGWPLAGLMGLPLVVFFIWWLVDGWDDLGRRRPGMFLAIPAIGQVLVLGVLSHGESRFVFFPLALVAIGAVAGAIGVTARWSDRPRRGVRFALVLLLIGSVAVSVATTRRSVQNRMLTFEPIELAADLVEDRSDAAGCAVMTSYTPQVTFYSGCFSDIFRAGSDPEAAVAQLEGEDRFMILVEDGRRQPTGDGLQGLIDQTGGAPIAVVGERDSATVYAFADN